MAQDLHIDFSCLSDRVLGASGLSDKAFTHVVAQATRPLNDFVDQHASGAIRFARVDELKAHLTAVEQLAAELRSEFDALVVLGIGGSSLGGKAALAALLHPFHNLLPKERRSGMQVFFPDNADPATWLGLMDAIDLERTAFAVITKSGGTAETWSQLLDLWARLGPKRAAAQIVAVTDSKKGVLRRLSQTTPLRALEVPSATGGRFSVLTPVGLFPASAAGIDVAALLEGAAQMAERCLQRNPDQNPAAMLAAALHDQDLRRHRSIHVLMPYVDALRETSDWFVQLWAESLGKNRAGGAVGPTPVRAVGATDQHSMVQPLMEGTPNKVVITVGVDTARRDFVMGPQIIDDEEVNFLSGISAHRLLNTEWDATTCALAQQGRPSIRIRLPELSPHSMGQLFMLFECTTAIAGGLYGINPYDQPGVEAGKRFIGGLLGRPGFERYREEIESQRINWNRWSTEG